MNTEPYADRRLRNLVNLRAAILGICLLNFVATIIRVRRIDREIHASGFFPGYWNPTAIMIEPLLLLAAAVGLLINRWWALVVALLASGRVIYQLGYLPWISVHNAHDVPMFSWQIIEKMWFSVYQAQPQYLFEVGLAAAIFVYVVVLLVRLAYAKPVLTVVHG